MIAWWNSKTIANTTRLWKPGLQPIQNTTLNTNSWYKSSIQKHIELTDDIISHELKEPIEHTITRKIKINPNLEQRKLLTEWWHAYRYTYNKTVEDIATNALSSTVRLFIKPETQIINPDKLLKFELGSRFELPSKWSVKFKIIDPKLKVTLKYTEKSGVKLKIKIVQDDYIKVNFDFTYPKIDHWHSYRDKYVTAPTLPFLKSVDKRIRASAVKDACANYKTISPVRTPVDGVQFDVRRAQNARQSPRKGGLAGARCPDHGDTHPSAPASFKQPVTPWDRYRPTVAGSTVRSSPAPWHARSSLLYVPSRIRR